MGLSAAATNAPIDGIPCTGALPTLAQHFHDHLTLYVNGIQYAIPVAIGIYHPAKLNGTSANPLVGFYNIDPNDATACHYDIHVHAADGVFHVETASATQTFYLKNFLDIWGVSMSTTGFWKISGPTRWFETDESVGGPGSYKVREITGIDPATIVLTKHLEFTVEIGTPLVAIPNYLFVETTGGL